MTKIRCLIVDDESIARSGLEKYLSRIPFMECVGSCKSAMQAADALHRDPVDLLFLDINMPQLKGTDFLRGLSQPPPVIFTTAYSEYALESFDFDVIDYLVKPISFERFMKAANKARQHLKTLPKNEDYCYISDARQLIKVPYADILYIASNQNYVNIITGSKKYMALVPLIRVLEQLPEDRFLQVHRTCIVNIQKVTGLEGNQLLLGNVKVQVARRLKEEVYERLFRDNLLK